MFMGCTWRIIWVCEPHGGRLQGPKFVPRLVRIRDKLTKERHLVDVFLRILGQRVPIFFLEVDWKPQNLQIYLKMEILRQKN